jgi:hypothetical protein
MPSEWPAAFDAISADIFSWVCSSSQQVLSTPLEGPISFVAPAADRFGWAYYAF